MAKNEDLQDIMDITNRAYAIESGSTGIAFKSTPRYQNSNEIQQNLKDFHVLTIKNTLRQNSIFSSKIQFRFFKTKEYVSHNFKFPSRTMKIEFLYKKCVLSQSEKPSYWISQSQIQWENRGNWISSHRSRIPRSRLWI